jgi:hypothetical protein
LARDPFSTALDYNSFYQKLGSPTAPNFINGNLAEITGDGIYYANTDITIDNVWSFPAGRKAIILIDGNLTIKKRITVPVGSFLAFIVSTNINITGNVGDKDAAPTPDLEGVYFCDGLLNTNSDNDTGSGFRLVAQGIFAAKGGFVLSTPGRDVKNDNPTTPAELFVFRPDFIANMPQALLFSSYSWQEKAP